MRVAIYYPCSLYINGLSVGRIYPNKFDTETIIEWFTGHTRAYDIPRYANGDPNPQIEALYEAHLSELHTTGEAQ